MRMTAPVQKVSVGLPVFNGQQHLPQAIESILGQTFTEIELIITDNASTDNTQEICRRYAASDPRIRYYRHPQNVGVTRNYNAAFGYARGIYFKWASANDFCEADFLAECVAVLDRRPEAVLACPLTRYVYADATTNDEQRLELADDSACARFTTFLRVIRLNNVLNGLIRTDVLKRTALHKPFRGSDTNLLAEVALHGKFAVVPDFLFNRRMDSECASYLRSDVQIEKMFEPECTKPMLFLSWKEDMEYFAAVQRARPALRDRLCLYRYLVRRMFRDRANLLKDLSQAGRVILAGRSGR